MQHLDPIAAPIDRPVRVLATTIKIHELVINRPNVVAYLEGIPSSKHEIALLHALEVGVTELMARRERFTR
jgi:hypothetical protein